MTAPMEVLVTGGGGFLGQAICARLVASRHLVRSLARGRYPELDALGVRQHVADVRDPAAVMAAVAGCQAVVHCAAKAGFWGTDADFEAVNVGGTANVIAACQAHAVPRLVYTSSPSVVHNGRDLDGVDESAPYATRFLAPYPRTKAAAERMVLAANSRRLATVALRPHLIWGPGDPHFLPRLVTRARAGQLRLLRTADKRVDTVYLDNAAQAHLLALARLTPGSVVAGRAYFISQGDPRSHAETLNGWLAAAGVPPVIGPRVPVGPVRALGAALETAYRLGGVRTEPPLTRFLVEHLSTAHWFDISAARRDLGYEPEVSTEEGLRRLAAHFAARKR
jgi:nucleoside-diphosphate-sugar epimerase